LRASSLTHHLSLTSLTRQQILNTQPIPRLILLLHHTKWQSLPNAKQHKRSPLPPKRVDHNRKAEPVDQLRVREELKRPTRRFTLDEPRHINPALHPPCPRSSERINKIHEQEARIYANMKMPNRANRIDIRAVITAYLRMIRRENLQIPIWRLVRFLEDFLGQEIERGPLVACGHDDNICFDEFFGSRAVLGDATRALVEFDA
jgi:hypothetical protein